MGDLDNNEVRLDKALEGCWGTTQKSRADAMRDLKVFFDKDNRSKLDHLSDKAYRRVYDGIFHMASAELAVYKLAKVKNTRSTAEARLDACGDIIRTVVKTGAQKLKNNTVKDVVAHIIKTLLKEEGGYNEPLAQNCLKALTTLFEFQPRVERMEAEFWLHVVDFCLKGLNTYLDEQEDSPRSHSGTGTSHPSSSLVKSSHVRAYEGSLNRQNVEELFQTLHLLLSASNSPLGNRYSEVGETTIRILKMQGSSASQLHQVAFSTLNIVLSHAREEQTVFCQSAAQEILPVICRLWQGKALAKDELLNTVRDEMLILLFSVHLHLERAIGDENNLDLLPILEELLEALKGDYAKRSDRDQLQLDDLDMADFGESQNSLSTPFCMYGFGLKPHNVRAERNWAILRSIGIIERLVAVGQERVGSAAGDRSDDVDNHPRKRQRVPDRLLELLRARDETLRLAGLQMISFILQDTQLSASRLSDLLTQLHICAGDKRGNITSWAFCTAQIAVKDISSVEWMQLWQLGIRSLTFSTTCRSAALELHAIISRKLVQYQDIGEDVGSIVTSADINGPVVLCDSSMFLMMDLLHSRVTEVPSASLSTAQHVIRWLFARWNPDEGNFAARYSINVQPQHIVALIRTCLGLLRVSLPSIATMPCGPLALAWRQHVNSQQTLRYLLLLDKFPGGDAEWSCPSCPAYSDPDSITYVTSSAHFQAARKLVLELLQPKCRGILQSWKSYLADQCSLVSADMFRSATNSCITILLLMSHFIGSTLPQPQLHSLEADGREFTNEIAGFLSGAFTKDPKGAQCLNEALLQSVQPYLPPCGSNEFRQLSEKVPYLLGFFISVAVTVKKLHVDTDGKSLESDVDMMDDNDDFIIREAHSNADKQREDMPRKIDCLETWTSSFYLAVTGHLLMIAAIDDTPCFVGVVTSFVDHLDSLDTQQFLASRRLLKHVIESDLTLDESVATRILERIALILQEKDYLQCEVAMKMCLETLVGLGSFWSAEEENDTADAASQLHCFFITHAHEKDLSSPHVQKGIAELLLYLMRSNSDYGASRDLPSPRSSLFKILQHGTISVQFYIGNHISQIFHMFILKDHDSVFQDVSEKLPQNGDQPEGIFFRLYVFAKLASSWPTLLRRCIYYIFEAAGLLPSCTEHAMRCMTQVASALNVNRPKVLFTLFRPQILYTWLDYDRERESVQKKIEEIPFRIFGFTSLEELVEEAQEEAMALLIMRGEDRAAQSLAESINVDYTDLIKKCFTKIIAYCVAHDTSSPSGSKDSVTGYTRMKNQLGGEVFHECLNLHFVDIIAIFFNIIESVMSAEKHFMKDPALAYAGNILDQIRSSDSTNQTLPPTQQPHFKVRHLQAWIQYICPRAGHDLKHLYTPALIVSIGRKLLNGIHPALGSLHACTVLRKLRVLIALAGNAAIQGYPLEMLIQSVRPFIIDPECAEDAFGIIKYLMISGSSALVQNPAFVAGISLAMLGSLREICDSQRASTTQESQHQNTISKAQQFHTWVGQYLGKYDSPELEGQSASAFRKLVEAAFTTGVGTADKNSLESVLLIQLLNDERNGGILLDRPSRELALSMLSSEFRTPVSFRNDILGQDGHSIDYAAIVWRSCRGSTNNAYLSWAARVLGRAFAASGLVHEDLLQESTLAQITELATHTDEFGSSISCVLNLLKELTLASATENAGLAETALRVILSKTDDTTYQKVLPSSLIEASFWNLYQIPPSEVGSLKLGQIPLSQVLEKEAIFDDKWLRNLSVAIAQSVPKEPHLNALVPILRVVPGFPERAFPFLVHLAISAPVHDQQDRRKKLSSAFGRWFDCNQDINKDNLKMLLNAILYLRTQHFPGEKSMADRSRWLDVDFLKAAKAASRCGMYKTSLLFTEEFYSVPSQPSRRSSTNRSSLENAELPTELLLNIFKNIDDPDSYYGVQQKASLSTILARFEHEKDGAKSLAFRGAQYDSHLRRQNPGTAQDVQSLVKALDNLNQSGISSSLLQMQQSVGMSPEVLESMFRTARKLEQWDIPVPSTGSSDSVTLYKAFQAVHMASDETSILLAVNEGLESTMRNLVQKDLSATALHSSLQTLAALAEMDEVLTSRGSLQFEEMLTRFNGRSTWMKTGSFDDISHILSCRGTTLSILNREPRLQQIMALKPIDTRIIEVRTALLASTVNRAHGALQESLSLATSMLDLIKPCHDVGVNPEVAIHLEAANALWDQGEMASSIGMLQSLDDKQALEKQTISITRPELLTKIGYQISVARLEKAEAVVDKYFHPALKEIQGGKEGDGAGQVFHQFAKFCDQQLVDPDGLEDLDRLKKLTKHKDAEVKAWLKIVGEMPSNISSKQKESNRRQLTKHQNWSKLDHGELKSHERNRSVFLRRCLENYLLALTACDYHDSNALRFCALWMEHSEDELANDAVSKYLSDVPSRKFALLMNQLSSRLQDSDSEFQKLLFSLVQQICIDHPFHGMYQIYAGVKSRHNTQDESSVLRRQAAVKLANKLAKSSVAEKWVALQTCNRLYANVAVETDEKYKSGRKLSLKDSAAVAHLSNGLLKLKLPPSTMHIPLAPNKDYSSLPLLLRLEPTFSIASGVSAPKIITALTTSGEKFKQLVKGGNDDLRQDAIMEQVFAQVSELLRTNKSTRQRNLKIRTYSVLPITNAAGVIEFVQNTQPLHDFLMPAHERYHPKDMKGSDCRVGISRVQLESPDVRVRKYREITNKFRPAMRYFFTEKFTNPDEWFVGRLAYTRSTAAISILGHVLGLGDRHGHNILLDAKNGEVVHIDLGVAFETGRVLPVPELVPFRLTRDIVDGMGITKTEGVFRRCCEFTLEALRKESYTIMAILDVLRYDPLYSWSVSPIRMAKIQEGQSVALAADITNPAEKKDRVSEAGEASRALAVVGKKLSKTLSVTATVNDLINQATDEKNLALLFSGWAAYA
ncbi:hypothetical protein LZ554_003587 [Drepanopeziza brunnea f. sp. 'monogermtubi']|nr:hypothetical protein LZ554_003587 [Drepanopeziza brunnea f. sp. 'monogermtubi']